MTKGWDRVKPRIIQLLEDGTSLKKTMKILEEQCNFKATERTYRYRIQEWKVRKVDKQRTVPTRTAREASSFLNVDELDPSSSSDHSLASRTEPQALQRMQGHMSPRPEAVDGDERELEAYFTAVKRNLHFAPTKQSRNAIFESLSFSNATDSFLHFSVRTWNHSESWDADLDTPIYAFRAQKDARWSRVESLVGYMVSRGISLDLTDSAGRTALHHLVRHGTIAGVRFFLGKDASPNVRTSDGLTPLHLAMEQQDEWRVRAICEYDVSDHIVHECLERAISNLEAKEDADGINGRLLTIEALLSRCPQHIMLDVSKRLSRSVHLDSCTLRSIDLLASRLSAGHTRPSCHHLSRMTLFQLVQSAGRDVEQPYGLYGGIEGSLACLSRCPAAACNSILEYCLFHAPSTLGIEAIESAIDDGYIESKYFLKILESIQSYPCKVRRRHYTIGSYEGILNRILPHLHDSYFYRYEGPRIRAIMGQDEYPLNERAELLKQLITRHPEWAHECRRDKWVGMRSARALSYMVVEQDQVECAAFARALYGTEIASWLQIISQPDNEGTLSLFPVEPLSNMPWYNSAAYEGTIAKYLDYEQSSEYWQEHIASAKQIMLGVTTDVAIQQCSEVLLNDNKNTPKGHIPSPASTLMQALDVRRMNDLPEVTISSKFLMHSEVLACLRSGVFVPTDPTSSSSDDSEDSDGHVLEREDIGSI